MEARKIVTKEILAWEEEKLHPLNIVDDTRYFNILTMISELDSQTCAYYEDGKLAGRKEVVEWAVAERKTLKLLKVNQKLEKPTDYQTQAMLGAKMRTLQLLINKFKPKKKNGG